MLVSFISCFKPKAQQFYSSFLGIAPKIDFLLLIPSYLSKMLWPLPRMFILVSPRIKRSLKLKIIESLR